MEQPVERRFNAKISRRLSELSEKEILALISLGFVVFLFVADVFIDQRPFAPRTFWALFDVLVHGVLALFVVFPLFYAQARTPRTSVLFYAVFLMATLLDLDHFVAAGSLNMLAALNLAARPATHSLTLASVVGILSILAFRNPALGWITFAALASHVLRDTAGSPTPIVWPLSVNTIPWWAYYLGEIMLFSISFLLRKRGWTV